MSEHGLYDIKGRLGVRLLLEHLVRLENLVLLLLQVRVIQNDPRTEDTVSSLSVRVEHLEGWVRVEVKIGGRFRQRIIWQSQFV